MGIYANVQRFDLNNYREYDSIDEAMDNGKFRLDLYCDEEKEILRKYLERILTYDNESKKYYNVKETYLYIAGAVHGAFCMRLRRPKLRRQRGADPC